MALAASLWRTISRRRDLLAGLALLATLLVLLNVLVSRHAVRGDWTASRIYSLSPKTKAALRRLQRPVAVTLFMVPPERDAESIYLEVRELLEQLQRASRQLVVERVDIDADPVRAELLAKRDQVRLADLREGVVVFSSGSRVKQVRVASLVRYDAGRLVAFRAEALLLGALLAVSLDDAALICFTAGHGEAPIDDYDDRGYALLADEVRREGYRVRGLEPHHLESLVGSCKVIVIGGPTRRFAQVEVDALDRFLRRGGRLLLLLGPVLDRRVTRYGQIGLEAWLRRWGVEVPANVVVDPHGLPGEQQYLTWGTRSAYGSHPVARALAGELTIWRLAREVRPVSAPDSEMQVAVLVRTSDRGWGESDLASLTGRRPLRFDAAVDSRGPVPVALAVRAKQSRLVVVGSERGVLNRHIEGGDESRSLVLAALTWLTGQDRQPGIESKAPEHVQLRLDDGQLTRVFLLCVVALPTSALFVGLIVWRRRRR